MNCRKNKLILYLLLSSAVAAAQDSHYWSNHYGAGGFFVPGSVIAFTGDSAVLFYNPALLVYAGRTKISVNATAYFQEKIKITNGAGTHYNLQSTNSGTNPLLVSGNIHFKNNPNISLAYGLVSEPIHDFHVSQRRDQQFQVLDDSYSPGPDYYVGQMIKENTIRRQSAMAGMGFRLTKKMYAGVYVEGNSRRQRYDLSFIGRALVNPPGNAVYPLVSTDFDYFASYTHISMRARVGLAYDGGRDHFGLLVQTPSVRLDGKGTILSDMVINNGNFLGFLINFIANTRQENLKSEFKQPLSIGLGYSRQMNRMNLYVGAEYFPAIDEYNVLTPRAEFFIRPDTGNNSLFTPDILKLKDARKSVLNLSAGASYLYNERISLYAAFRTDNSYFSRAKYADDSGFEPYNTTWNLYHLQLGLDIKKPKYNLRAGIYTALGKDKSYEQDINFDNPTEGNFLQGEASSASASYFALGVLISYIHNF